MTAYLISDLHLSPQRPELTRSFLRFLQQQVIPEATELYILGDFFEYWIGHGINQVLLDEISGALRTLAIKYKIKTYFMPGNRDFLVDAKFCASCKMTLLSDPTKVEIQGEAVLLMHGDSLCTQDKWYQRYRKLSRNAMIQKLFLALPLTLRQSIADKLRQQSNKHTPRKPAKLLDVDHHAALEAMSTHQVKTLIHGHTHRPAVHWHKAHGDNFRRIVLGDWGKENWVLKCDQGTMQLVEAGNAHPHPHVMTD